MALLNNNHQKLNYPLCSLLYKSSLFVMLVTLFLSSVMKLSASQSIKDKAEEAIYKKGVAYQKEKKWDEAIECFKPLAEKQYVEAQHYLAFCLFKVGENMQAYSWARQASNHGFRASKKDLERMNLMDLLLPIELVTRIVSYFSIEDIPQFNLVSRRAYKAVRASVTGTNFLTSKKPYAVHFRSLFSNIHFEPQPTALRFCLEAKVENGSLEVHFRDRKHLKSIVSETPLMEVEDRLYFVHDVHAKDSKELVASNGVVNSQYVIYFSADTPLKVTGNLSRNLTHNIRFPKGSDLSALSITNQRSVGFGSLTTYSNACELLRAIKTFDEQLWETKTEEAFNLLKDRSESRRQKPVEYPEWQTICPDAALITAAKLSITQRDYIAANKPLIYMASSIPNMLKLQGKLPTFSHPILYVNPTCAKSRVYCDGPLEVQKGFEISTPGDLTVGGSIKLQNYNLKFNVGGAIWLVHNQLSTNYAISIYAIGDIVFENVDKIIAMNRKPDKMPGADWQKLLQFWQKKRFVHR